MANNIALAQNYLAILDGVYKRNAIANVLESPNVQFVGADTVNVYKMTVSGFGDYDRDQGFKTGSVNGSWETHKLAIDRGIKLDVDRMDNEESLSMAYGKLLEEFGRTQMAPELDAYTFAKIAGTQHIQTATPADIVRGTTDVAALIDEGEYALNEQEVPNEGRILFVSEAAYAGLRSKITRQITNGEGNLNNGIDIYNDMRVVRVPQSRFYTAITLNDGTTDFGYTKGTNAKKINFMIVHPSAILKVTKLAIGKLFTPDENQQKDSWSFQPRLYHDTFVYENKVGGVYLHAGATNA